MADTTLTIAFNALASSTLTKFRPKLMDQVSKANLLLFKIMKGERYKRVSDIGRDYGIPLLQALTGADTYRGYDPVSRTPMNGINMSIWDYANYAVPIMISRDEEKKNQGSETRLFSLLEAKIQQSLGGLQDLFIKSILQGNGINTASAVTTPYTSPNNGSLGVVPIPLLVKKDPSTGTVGGVDPAVETNWRNQVQSFDTLATFAAQLHALRKLRALCMDSPGGPPDVHFADMDTWLWYQKALAAAHQNPSYQKADIPFEAVSFFGDPVVFDTSVINAKDENTTLDAAEGSWYMLHSPTFEIQVESDSDFATTEFTQSESSKAKSADILWGPGALGTSARRKNGVGHSINTAVAS